MCLVIGSLSLCVLWVLFSVLMILRCLLDW